MTDVVLEKKEKSRSLALSENIRRFLSLNHLSQKKAAELAGLLPTTLNSWIKKKAYPREKNLQKLADVFHVNIVDLTGDVEAADERRKYLTIGASDMLAAYSGDREFRQWCDLGLKLRRRKRMHAYIQNLEKMLEEEDATG